jgi:hypothetical protein
LGFLGLTSAAFAPIAFSVTVAIGSFWRQDILHHGAHLMNFKLPAIVLVVLIALVAFGPLAFFTPRLAELRRKGVFNMESSANFTAQSSTKNGFGIGPGTKPSFLRPSKPAPSQTMGEFTRRLKK